MNDATSLAELSRLDRPEFVRRLGAVFEHSPWVIERAWEKRPFADKPAFYARLAETLNEAGRERQLALINAHPELAGKAAIRGELTADSAREQAGAGLDACTPEEFTAIRRLNDAYREKFGWPFIIAVKGLSRPLIIAEMRRRLARPADEEFAEALSQIIRIASFRLDELIAGD